MLSDTARLHPPPPVLLPAAGTAINPKSEQADMQLSIVTIVVKSRNRATLGPLPIGEALRTISYIMVYDNDI